MTATYTVYYRDPESHELVPHPDHTSVEHRYVPGAVTLRCNGWVVKEDPPEAEPEAGENPKDLLGSKKVDLSLVPPAAIEAMARALEEGAAKYGPFNWRENQVKARVYVAAAMRHIGLWLDGEECAQDSGNHHIDNALGSLAVLKDAISLGNLEDDRPPPGRVSYARRAAEPAEPKAEARYRVDYLHGGDRARSVYLGDEYSRSELTESVRENPGRYHSPEYRAVNVDDPTDTFLLSELEC